MLMKFIHLLYVPTMNCNLQCRYCYLGADTVDEKCPHTPLETLRYAVEKLKQADVIPFNISLHGGEVTTLNKEECESVVAYIFDYYEENRTLLTENNFRVGRPHIKTNLYDLAKHMDTIRKYNVSISGSLDLPLSMHREYRVTKGNQDTLPRILENIRLLETIPNRNKVSATIFKEHFERLDEMAADIRYLHENTCLDMNDFNFMVGFASDTCPLTPMTQAEQVALFARMQEEFTGTDLQPGLDHAWFAEFTQDYCTNCDLCGEKFFLLERNGDVYSCVRGQKNPDFYYGNIYENTVEEILQAGRLQSLKAHSRVGFHPDCAKCPHLHLCKTGCPYVKNQYGDPKSYTCLLQKEIYAKNREPAAGPEYPYVYLRKLHPHLADAYYPKSTEENSLDDLIARDPKLQQVYDPDAFLLRCDGQEIPVLSQLLKPHRDILFVAEQTELTLFIRKEVMEALADYPVNNALYMMLLSGNMVVYGDEQRQKQEHIATWQVFRNTLARTACEKEGYYSLDLMPLLRPWLKSLPQDVPNNLFFTTTALRDYHYTKQKNNGFYHMAALNLPFQNIEFYYVNLEDMENDSCASQDL